MVNQNPMPRLMNPSCNGFAKIEFQETKRKQSNINVLR